MIETGYTVLLFCQFAFAVMTFILLYFINAPYGRHLRSGWGPLISPGKAWLFMEIPASLVMFVLFFTGSIHFAAVIFLVFWQIHYLYRTFVYPFLIKSSRKVPFTIVLFSFLFNSMNGFINGYYVFHRAAYTVSWFYSPQFIAGSIVFLAGFFINIHSDRIIQKMKKSEPEKYQIPFKGMHKFVASPNYFGEIVEWGGWALMTWSLPGLAFFIFTVANLVPRANAHFKWYRKKFPDYPSKRKRVIPLVY